MNVFSTKRSPFWIALAALVVALTACQKKGSEDSIDGEEATVPSIVSGETPTDDGETPATPGPGPLTPTPKAPGNSKGTDQGEDDDDNNDGVEINVLPVWSGTISDFSMLENTAISDKSVTATDSNGGDTPSYSLDLNITTCDDGSWSSLIAIDETSGAISGTPSNGDIGTCVVGVIANSGADTIATSFVITVVATPLPPAPPTNVTNAAFTTYQTSTPEITWSPSPTGDIGYVGSIGTSAGGSQIVNEFAVGDVTSHTFDTPNLTDCETYHVSIKATDIWGITSSAALSDTTFIYDGTAPSLPADVAKSGVGSETSSETLTWSASTDDCLGAVTYEVALGNSDGIEELVPFMDVGTNLSHTFTGVSLDFFTDYYLSVRSVDGAGNKSGFLTTDAFQIFQENSVTGITLWLDASDPATMFTDEACTTPVSSNGDGVACWRDKSVNGLDFLQSTPGYRPTYLTNSINGNSALDFADGDFIVDMDGESSINGYGGITSFIVVQSDTTSTDAGIFHTSAPNGADDMWGIRYDVAGASAGCTSCIKAGVHNELTSHTQVETDDNSQSLNTQIIAYDWESDASIRVFLNGLTETLTFSAGTLSGTTGGADRILIGKGAKDTGAANGWNGRIVEVLIYDSKLSDGDRQIVSDYLKGKWGI
jgi:hypothetical protein